MASVGFSEDSLLADICKESFFDFVKEFWEVIVPEKPVWNWHIPYLCKETQIIAERVFAGKPREYNLVVNISPGSTKSTLLSVMFPAWTWTRMASTRCICGSYALPLAMDLSRKGRDIIESDKYRRLYPKIKLREDQNTKSHYVNTEGGIRYAVGMGGSVTGMHAHFIIVDDPLDPNRALSEAEIKSTNSWMNETLSSRTVNKEVSVQILIMQRLHQDDPTGNKLSRAGSGAIKHICLPADDSWEVKPEKMKYYYDDGLMDPIRLSRRVLDEARATLGEFGYSGQYGQSPVPLGGAMFKLDFLYTNQAPPPKFRRVIRYWDKAGSHGKGAFTVGVKMAIDTTGRFWILDVKRGQWEASTREAIIEKTAKEDGRDVWVGVEQEPGSGGKESAEGTVRRLAGWKVLVDKVTGDKVLRADPFATQVNGGNVYVVKAPWVEAYLDEMRFFPVSKYKDQIDASSGAFAILSKARARAGAL